MDRRTFLSSLPVAAGALPLIGSPLAAQTSATAPPGPDDGNRPDIHAGDRTAGASFATRSMAYGRNGAAGAAHPLAVLAGIETLKRGGSAVDAAIAINACLGFLEPVSCGIGGDCYAMLWDPKLGKVVGLAGSGRSPRALSLATMRSRAVNGVIPAFNSVSVSVPGAVDAWWTLHQRYGRLDWADLFEPAIALASDGAPVPEIIAANLKRELNRAAGPNSKAEEKDNARKLFAPGGETPRAGEIFRNPDLARTYKLIAEGGRDAFYEGPVADIIDAYFKRIGGFLTKADLAGHRSEWTNPLATTYRGVHVHAIGANTQGMATLQMLNILENFDISGAGFQTALSLHLQASAKRLAFEDRARFYADPDFAKIPTDWLLSKDYAAERARLIRPDRMPEPVFPGQAPGHGDTTYFTVSDKDGMMVSWIQSNFRGLGSGLVPDGLGFMLQNRGQLFSLRDGHPNLYAPGKRPFQTIIPGFATKDGQPWMSFGVMGGDMQPQGQTQIIVNRVDYGLDAQAAGDSPRWYHEGSSQSMSEDDPGMTSKGELHVESGVPETTKAGLVERGWIVTPTVGDYGRYHCIERRRDGDARVYAAASEMRADGIALAY